MSPLDIPIARLVVIVIVRIRVCESKVSWTSFPPLIEVGFRSGGDRHDIRKKAKECSFNDCARQRIAMREQSPSQLLSGADEVVVVADQTGIAYEANIEAWLIGSLKSRNES